MPTASGAYAPCAPLVCSVMGESGKCFRFSLLATEGYPWAHSRNTLVRGLRAPCVAKLWLSAKRGDRSHRKLFSFSKETSNFGLWPSNRPFRNDTELWKRVDERFCPVRLKWRCESALLVKTTVQHFYSVVEHVTVQTIPQTFIRVYWEIPNAQDIRMNSMQFSPQRFRLFLK